MSMFDDLLRSRFNDLSPNGLHYDLRSIGCLGMCFGRPTTMCAGKYFKKNIVGSILQHPVYVGTCRDLCACMYACTVASFWVRDTYIHACKSSPVFSVGDNRFGMFLRFITWTVGAALHVILKAPTISNGCMQRLRNL